jgi:protein-L-isoaspartate(D-aspartate) O-methyltransferase
MSSTLSAEAAAARRRHMVDGQLRVVGVDDLALLAAFLDTPREGFVAPSRAGLAYLDSDQPALGSAQGRRLLAPSTLARLLQAAAVKPGDRALDVAGGSGYGAAILARLGARVTAIESDPGAAAAARRMLAGTAGTEVIVADLAKGAPDRAPFDVIVVEGGFETPPETLLAELAEGGRLVGVETAGGAAEAALFERSAAGSSRRALFETSAATLEAFRRAPSFAF